MTGIKRNKADFWLIFCYFALLIIGWLNIYASIQADISGSIFDFGNRAGKQFVWILTAIPLAALVLYIIDSRIYEVLSFWFYIAVLGLLFITIFIGKDIKGSNSWISLGPVSFQPAEISKISTSLFLATVMSQFGFKLTKTGNFLEVCLIIAVPMLLIIAEKETGSALVYTGFVFMLYREGLSGWLIAVAGLFILLFILTLTLSPFVSILTLMGIVAVCYAIFSGRYKITLAIAVPVITLLALLPKLSNAGFMPQTDLLEPQNIVAVLGGITTVAAFAIGFKKKKSLINVLASIFTAGMLLIFSVDFIFDNILQEHQRKRIEVLLGMEQDPTGVGYNVTQSMIAIGSGGFSGKGYLQGTQTAFGFVPEQSTDFIFCTIGEEWGFIGTFSVVALYVFLLARIILLSERCGDNFTRIYGYCVACCLFMHFFINIGMTIGLMPVIGIPLPFISYGGSSLWGFTVMLFIFIALHRRQKR